MGEGHTGEPRTNQERLTVAQAAQALGITEGAVRSRIKRGTLRNTKEGGTVYVLLGGGTSQANQTPNDGEPTDQTEFVAQILDRVASLERQLQRREEETERLHQIIGGLAQANAEQARTIRAIEAPASEEEAAEDAETVEEAPEQAAPPRSDASGPHTGGERRPWWRRVFGE